ncbi:MAG: tripartite tricarboxylate transporter substrate binding protein [Proteobacteria bacterium]|nr:tripartite tricarboxylate transporter substrate binding protein [Pseudomonadota bacterium]
MRHAVCCTLTAIALSLAGPVLAQTAGSYPSKPLRLVVGFPAGGPADIFGRSIAQKLTEVIGQQVVVDNRAGAGGIVATENVAKSPADGYTFYLASSAVLSFYANLYDKLPYDLNRDFVPVTLAVAVPEMLVVHPSLPVKTAKEFVALAKSKPGQLVYGSTGNGNMPNLAFESFKIASGTNILHVPYKGAAPAVIDLLGGHVQATILDLPVLLPHVQGGRMRALAIATAKRATPLPNVPTMIEAGYPSVNADNWYGIVVAAATPKDVIAKLHAALTTTLQSADLKQKFAAQGATSMSTTPEELAAYMRDETLSSYMQHLDFQSI